MLRERDGRFRGDAGTRGRAVYDEDQGLVKFFRHIDGFTNGAQIVRRGTRRHNDEIGMRNDLQDRIGNGGRCIDDRELRPRARSMISFGEKCVQAAIASV